MFIFSHAASSRHVTPEGHPERAARMGAVLAGLKGQVAEWREMPRAQEADILRAHTAQHLARVRGAVPSAGPSAGPSSGPSAGPSAEFAQLDGDTFMSQGSLEAAMRAAGGACAAVDAVLAEGGRAFVAARPPGHHSGRGQAMGFCLFSTVAIAALRALEHHGLSRVAVVDFDVHHGNGTQDILWDEARCFFASTHQMPLYPGSGLAGERGAHGQMLNVPLRAGGGGSAMRAAYEGQVFPALRAFAPELVIISAGFDAHEDDPLGGLGWRAEDYAWLTAGLCEIADECAEGRVVSCLEGGYNRAALQTSVAAHCRVLFGGATGGGAANGG